MPFTMMADLSHKYHSVVAHPQLTHDFVTTFIQQVFFSAYRLVLPLQHWFDLPAIRSFQFTNSMDYTYMIENNFLSLQPVFLKIFLLKLPYLIFDLGVLFILPLFFKKDEEKKFVFSFWIFNPVALVVSFVFGTPDVIAVFFLALALYRFYKDKLGSGFFFLLLSISSKSYTLLIVPFAIIFMLKRIKLEKDALMKTKLVSILILGCAGILGMMVYSFYVYYPFRGTALDWPYNYIFLTQLNIGDFTGIYLFIAAYSILVLSYWLLSDASFSNFWKFSFCGILSFFALCFFHPQWFLVAIPFLSFAIIQNRQILKLFFVQAIFYFFIFLWWGNHLTVNLFMPVNPAAVQAFPDIKEVITNNFLQSQVLVNVAWSIFVAITLFIIYLIIKSAKLTNLSGEKNQ